MPRLDCNALALLVVRLESDQPKENALHWHTWDNSPGAELHGLPEGIGPRSGWSEPYKHLPGEQDAVPYFNPHVERLLFPPETSRGKRLLCCPDELYLELGKDDWPVRQTRIDLLERVTTPLIPGCTFGLVHLSLLPTDEPAAPDTLWWRKMVASTFSQKDLSKFTLRQGDESVALARRHPVRSLVEELFGDPDRYLERSLYTVLMATYPPGENSTVLHEAWRQALVDPMWIPGDPDEEREDREETFLLGRNTILLSGKVASFTRKNALWDSHARNFRSYWGESIVFGLLQQECLEEFQRRLADIDDLRGPAIEKLRDDWFKFRNVLWWSQLSSSSRIPQELVFALRKELGTERLFADLEGDLATYSEHRHQTVEDQQAAALAKQETALANLQIYGFPIVVLGTLATTIALFESSEDLRAILIAASALFALAIMVYVRTRLKRQS